MYERIAAKAFRLIGRVRDGLRTPSRQWPARPPGRPWPGRASPGRIGPLELKSVRIQNYRSIDDSGVVPIEEITCLVGKNESGKTAFLHALHLLNPLNPIRGKVRFDDVMDFPSRRFSAYRKVREQEPADVVTAVFELSDNELRLIESDL